MFANAHQGGFISIFFSVGSNPLALWDKQVKNGHIRRIIDDEVKSLVLDIGGTNVATTYITCPIKPRASLGVKLPYLVMIIKNMKKYFSFEIQILDDKDMRRRFRVSNFQSTTKVRPFCTTMPIGLSAGWNQVQFNLADFTKRAYGSVYMETTRVQIHANVRIRRIYFTDQLHTDDELPNEFKLFAPGPGTKGKEREERKSKEIAPEDVPAIKIEKKEEEEESPPPPTPTEEFPVPKEALQVDQSLVDTEWEPLPEGEGQAAAGEEQPKAEGEEPVEGGEAPPTEGTDETQPAEGEEIKTEDVGQEGEGQPPTDTEAPIEGEGEMAATEETATTGEAPTEETGEGDIKTEEAPPEGVEESPEVKPDVDENVTAEAENAGTDNETTEVTEEIKTEVTEEVTDTEPASDAPAEEVPE